MFLALPFRKAEYIHLGLLNNFMHIMTNTILSIIYIVEILMKRKVSEGAESFAFCTLTPRAKRGLIILFWMDSMAQSLLSIRKGCYDNVKRPMFRFIG